MKALVAKGVVGSATYPLVCCKTLIQLGHEPFPLSTGKVWLCAGRDAYFLPNLFSYASQLKDAKGWASLFTGLDSAIVKLAVEALTTHYTSKYIDLHYEELGGEPQNLDAEEKDIDDSQSFRRKLRLFIRDSFVRVVAVTASRPFTVAMVRQVAQMIGNETKYGTCIQAVKHIGTEEGPAGLFAGLVPQIIGEILVLAGIHGATFLAERVIFHIGMYENQDEKSQKEAKEIRRFVDLAIPFVVQAHGYPYQVVSTVIAVAGSGLAVSFLPYSPAFLTWQSAWDYLRPHGLKRGARMFLREQTGAVTVGVDQQLYASNKYFA